MASPPLHIICGSCGRSDALTYKIVTVPDEERDGSSWSYTVIGCDHCETEVDLDVVIPQRPKAGS